MPRSRRVIGVDESGKGDFFGPLVVAAFLADDSETEALRSMGVRDGKLISEKKILEIDERLRDAYPHALVVLEPAEYNRLHQRIKNLNKLLAEGHAEAIKQVLMAHRADLAVSDKFGKPELTEDALRNKGEGGASTDSSRREYCSGGGGFHFGPGAIPSGNGATRC